MIIEQEFNSLWNSVTYDYQKHLLGKRWVIGISLIENYEKVF